MGLTRCSAFRYRGLSLTGAEPDASPGLPQQWPAHREAEQVLSPFTIIPPLEEGLLDFAAMCAETFELCCLGLLRKDRSLIGCKRLGESGSAQGGIDLLARDAQQPDRLSVFECKDGKGARATKLTAAINGFLSNG